MVAGLCLPCLVFVFEHVHVFEFDCSMFIYMRNIIYEVFEVSSTIDLKIWYDIKRESCILIGAQWVVRLTRNVEAVRSSPIKGPRCFLDQETLPLLLIGWFQERIRA